MRVDNQTSVWNINGAEIKLKLDNIGELDKLNLKNYFRTPSVVFQFVSVYLYKHVVSFLRDMSNLTILTREQFENSFENSSIKNPILILK